MFQAKLAGKPHRTNLVERSTDLEAWTPLTNVVNLTGEAVFQVAAPDSTGPFFYRAKQTP